MNRHDLYMKLFGWFIHRKVRKESEKNIKLRPLSEILDKQIELKSKILAYERAEDKVQTELYKHYLTVLEWIIGSEQ